MGSKGRQGAQDALEALRVRVESCRACPLWEGRTNVVFGAGSAAARVLIVGEAPGKNEDLSGKPFVGAAGKNLDSLLALAGLVREEAYIANVLKCRPPQNRNPQSGEIAACAPHLYEQMCIIGPEFIVTLGNFATKFVLKTSEGITRLHGTLRQEGGLKVYPVYHPAAAIYDRSKQAVLEDDFRTLGVLLAQSAPEAHLG